MECVGTGGSAGLGGGLVPVLEGVLILSTGRGQAQGPLIHIPASPCPYAFQKLYLCKGRGGTDEI